MQHAHDSRLILSRSRWWFYEEVDIRPWPMLCVSLVSEWMHVRREWTAPSVITLHVNSRSSSFRSTRRTSPGTWHVCSVISPTIEEQAKHIRSSSFVGLRIHTVSKIDECWVFLSNRLGGYHGMGNTIKSNIYCKLIAKFLLYKWKCLYYDLNNWWLVYFVINYFIY